MQDASCKKLVGIKGIDARVFQPKEDGQDAWYGMCVITIFDFYLTQFALQYVWITCCGMAL